MATSNLILFKGNILSPSVNRSPRCSQKLLRLSKFKVRQESVPRVRALPLASLETLQHPSYDLGADDLVSLLRDSRVAELGEPRGLDHSGPEIFNLELRDGKGCACM